MSISHVSVIGGGLMGTGIALVIAEANKKVQLIEVSQERIDSCLFSMKKTLERKVSKGKLSEEEMNAALQRIDFKTSMDSISESDLVIEAVPENLDIKKAVFAKIDKFANEKAILASNTSGLSIAAIGSATKRPENVIGLHYFYPVPVMELVEVTPSIVTSQSTIERSYHFVESIFKKPVKCKDYPGFLVNRLLIPMVNEAIYCVMEGTKPEDVDAAMKLGANHRMGPITLADFVGLDVLLATMEGLYEGFSDSKYRPCPLLKKLVESGNYGKKTGRGFYQYNEDGSKGKSVV
ncbi:3-hydroxyacyl-CoA dehydrogenase family protein [Halalkalibacterium ligniniphilum]|uniref:3-hydroxyacyl-CoA dehydrogenase family protein n=1 Tax=Halalkalibacterium ligniniphilum TaxID=1134413 RepID=UPI000347A212|nr:3-hydroxyacyl-CoA dehydrogenase NAD-binding domain-containing protein [Halalkalibacterium ligniniphilum]